MIPVPGLALSRLLDAAEDASPVGAVEAVTNELRTALGATAVSLLIVDLSGRALVRLAHVSSAPGAASGRDGAERRDDEESATVLPFRDGPAEQALSSQQVQVLAPCGQGDDQQLWTVLAPVTERGEPLGLLELSLADEPDAGTVAEIARTAHVLAYVLIASRRHTDLFEWGQRSVPLTLAAEIQRRLLPAAFTCEAGSFTLSAWIEPAASVGGDTFDYSLDRDVLHLSMTDAMGHSLTSALTATLCVGSLRNTRRQGGSLLEQADAANAALVEQHAADITEGFATGLIGRLDLATGTLALVNAGHVAPYLARSGQVTAVELPVGLPLGLFDDAEFVVAELALRPGDRLVLVTDGMLERNAAHLDLPDAIGRSRSAHAREATRALADSVLVAAGRDLQDDATLLVLDWHGDHGQDRSTVAGADSS